jgi:hypothetical protein
VGWTHDSATDLGVQGRQLEEMGRRGGPDNQVGGRVPQRLLTPRVADLRDRRVVRQDAVFGKGERDESTVPSPLSLLQFRSPRRERERLTFPTRATLAERRDDRHRVVAHAQQIKLGQPDAAETSHGRAEQPAVRVEEELPERVPVRVESAVDQERLERGRVDGRRQVG